jgi:hypothetical protein
MFIIFTKNASGASCLFSSLTYAHKDHPNDTMVVTFIIHYSLLQLLRYIARSCNIVDVIFLSFIAHAECISRAKSDATTIQQIHQIVTNKHLKILQNQTNPKTCCSMKLI